MASEPRSLGAGLAALPPEKRAAFLASLDEDELAALEYAWEVWARPSQLEPPGDWSVWLICAGRGFGKALALDTPLPTPTGWTTMGDVRVGDTLFDERGLPCTVTFTTEVQLDRTCYDVVFDDGTVITADADHLWLTRAAGPCRWLVKPQLVTTSQMAATVALGHRIDCPSRAVRVEGVHPRPSVPVRCIQVNSPSHLFLASRSCIPTHNTRTAAETVRKWVETGRCKRLALVARTASDVRDVLVEGESGILAISPPWCKPTWEPTKRRLTWPNGAVASTYSSEQPDLLRGPQFDGAVCDELAAWRYEEAWANLLLGLRLGDRPRVVVATTPRPTRLLRTLLADPSTTVTRGGTRENEANLAPTFLQQVVARFQGTRLARQELEGELLEEAEGALWGRDRLDALRVRTGDVPELVRVVVAVDPATTNKADSDETGIIVAGVAGNGNAYVLDDLSGRYSPDGWAQRAVAAFEKHSADRIVLETNQGGDMVVQTIRTVMPNAPLRRVAASRGKRVRAEPVAALYEQGRVFHVGALPELEDQMVCWDASSGAPSPDRVDALVWALTDLAVTGRRPAAYEPIRIQSRRWSR